MPATGSGPSNWSTTPASCDGSPKNRSPRPLHEKSSAPRLVGVDAREQRPEVVVGRVRVAHVKLHGLADLHDVGHGEAARRGVGGGHCAHEEVARLEVELVFVDDDPEVQAHSHEEPVLLARRPRPPGAG